MGHESHRGGFRVWKVGVHFVKKKVEDQKKIGSECHSGQRSIKVHIIIPISQINYTAL